eukprot:CAMPEP_0113944180 /NCGR_PEP_ID=MMETSP1339-20121228/30851_1 /TAXON_ID=94617 /ORGANISM="Fibrocapsa japonica" /LENGTH=183 /DNA_ID=CAMNT_0000949267 /DNA_START=129 /DNA_END=676 /DNA_ORIENTATION=+ /assembly_acc=CAM_ASM_000762
MGGWISALWKSLGKQERRMLMLGLDSAGKTTILYKLRLGEALSTIPTIGFNVERVTYNKLEMTIWDVGGQDKIRPLWRHYYQGTDALIFVVDSQDRERIQQACEELLHVLADEEMRDCQYVLVYANKQDLPGSMTASEVVQKMKINNQSYQFRNRKWFVQACCAVTGEGLYEGLDWLNKNLTG